MTTTDCRAGTTHLLVTVPGPDLDVANAGELRARLSALDPEDPTTVVVVDLSAVTFMDCAGLGSLVAARARFGSRLLLRGAGPRVLRLLDLTRLSGMFNQAPSS